MSTLLDEIYEVTGGNHYGTYLAVKCPYHGDHSPSMLVYEDWFTCKSCGENGPTTKLLKKVKGGAVNFSYGHEEEQHFPNPFGYWLKKEKLGHLLKRAWINANLNPGYMVYLRETRGINDTERAKLGIGVIGEYFTFPVLDQSNRVAGAFVRSSGRILSSRYFVPKGQNPNLLYAPSWKRVQESRVVFLTFGPIDAISLYLLGYASLSTLSGKTLDTSVLDDIRKRIVFIPDYGEDKEAQRLAAKLGWRGSVCDFPYQDQDKDMNDVYRNNPELIVTTLQEYMTYGNKLEGCLRDRGRADNQRPIVGERSPSGPVLSSV